MLPYAVLFVISHYSIKRWNKNPLDLWPRVEHRKLVLEEKTHTIKNRITKKSTRQEESPEKSKKQEKTNKTCIFLSFCFLFCFFLVSLVGVLFVFCFLLFFPWVWLSSFFVRSGFVVFCCFCQTLYSLCCWTHNIRHGAYNCHWRLTVQPNQVKQVYVMETRWMLAKCCTSW
jgi:hypothetical protein